MSKKKICPLLAKPCIKDKCEWWAPKLFQSKGPKIHDLGQCIIAKFKVIIKIAQALLKHKA